MDQLKVAERRDWDRFLSGVFNLEGMVFSGMDTVERLREASADYRAGIEGQV